MATFTSTRRQGRSSSRSPEYFDTGEQQAEREREVKTYSDLIVLKQDAHDMLGEPARWVLYVADFDKLPNPAMDKARAEQWMNMYSILDRSTFEESCVRAHQGIVVQFPSHEFSDRRSTASISRAAFSRNIRQISTTLPRIIRVCRLLIRRELR
jgi:hypothetical protein